MSTKILGVLGGGDVDERLLASWVRSADTIFAADGAANRLTRMQVGFQAVIGDMDSAEAWALPGTEVIHLPDQNTTDCDKLLAYAAMRGFESMTLTGIEGDLPDHVLAILHSGLRTSMAVRLAYRQGMGWILKPNSGITVACQPGARVSLLPLTETCDVNLSGVTWPLASSTMVPGGFTSVSNAAIGGQVSASIGEGGAFLFVGYPAEAMPFW